MKALIVGGGSIGRRHLENLKVLGVDKLAIAETNAERRRFLADQFETEEFPDISEALEWSPDFVVLATPTHLHAEQAMQVLHRGFNLFVEKPLCHTPETLGALSKLAERKRVISLVGCNMRFHPGPAKVKELLKQGRLGKLLFARIHAGSYLPDWHPKTDYRRNHAASELTGGGCILDCIHEIDLARWYLGDVQEVFCVARHVSSLEISTEDMAALTCTHWNGVISEIHLDYVQRTYERGCQIVGERGAIFWDFNSKRVRWFDAETNQWIGFSQPENWQSNQMYVDEMRHFLECVRLRKQSVLSIPEAAAVMQIAFTAKASARQRKALPTEREVVA